MRKYVATDPTGDGVQVRIGINSGPGMAAIVGTARFHYDVPGDAVNVASRMESTGEPGKIQITETTHRHISAEFSCKKRGQITVKGKGEMTTWIVV
jgi:adenylate cyclase